MLQTIVDLYFLSICNNLRDRKYAGASSIISHFGYGSFVFYTHTSPQFSIMKINTYIEICSCQMRFFKGRSTF